jgi:NADPH:quinone reductase
VGRGFKSLCRAVETLRPCFGGPPNARLSAARDLTAALEAGWPGFEISERIPLAEIARAHELAEHAMRRGPVVVMV